MRRMITITIWVLYAINSDRTAGFTHFFQGEGDAEAMAIYLQSRGWETRWEKRQYEDFGEEG